MRIDVCPFSKEENTVLHLARSRYVFFNSGSIEDPVGEREEEWKKEDGRIGEREKNHSKRANEPYPS